MKLGQKGLSVFLISLLAVIFPVAAEAADYHYPQSGDPFLYESMMNGRGRNSHPGLPDAGLFLAKAKTGQEETGKQKEQGPQSGPDAETWNLSIASSLTGAMPTANGVTTIVIKADGKAILKIDKTGRLTGSGTLSVMQTVTIPPNPAVRFGPITGGGRFTVTGSREGDYLVFSFDRGEIPLEGTMTVTTPEGTVNETYTSSFDPSTLVPTPTAVDRKDGGTSTIKISVSPATGTTFLTLSGGRSVVKESASPKELFPRTANNWTLEFECRGNWELSTPEISGSGECIFEGKAVFPLPLNDGPARGEGPMGVRCSSSVTRPLHQRGSSTSTAVLVLDGRIEKETLTFKPRAKLQTVEISQAPPEFAAFGNFGEGLWIFDQAEEVTIPVKDGAETVQNFSPPVPNMTSNWKVIWRLKGNKVENWQAVIEQWNTIVFGTFKPGGGQTVKAGKSLQYAAGLKVHTRRVIDLVIENDNYKSGSGKSFLVSVSPYSNPAGVYQCRPVAGKIIGTGTDIEAERWDQVRNAKRFNPEFMTEEDAALKKKWEKIDENRTPYIFPPDYPVDGVKKGKQVRLILPEESGYTVAYHCILDANEAVKKLAYRKGESPSAKPKEELSIDRYLFGKSAEIMLVDGWSRKRMFSTESNADSWFEGSHGINTENLEVITVKRIK